MRVIMHHDFSKSIEINAIENAENFTNAKEPLRDDLLSQVQMVLRQNKAIIELHEQEVIKSKADLEGQLKRDYPHKVREWDSKRQTHYQREILPLEKKIKFREEQNSRLEKCLDFHTKEVKRREKAKLDNDIKQFPKRVKSLEARCKDIDKQPLIKKVYELAKELGKQNLFDAIQDLASIPQDIESLQMDRALFSVNGKKRPEIPKELMEMSKEIMKLNAVCEQIVGRPYPLKKGISTKRRLEFSKLMQDQQEAKARKHEGFA